MESVVKKKRNAAMGRRQATVCGTEYLDMP